MLRPYDDIELCCYDGEDEVKAAEAAASAEAAKAEAAKDKTFTQSQVNAYLAEERRKAESKHKAELKIELQRQEKNYNELLTNKNLTEQDRDALRDSLAEVEKQLHSEKELLTREKKAAVEQLTEKLTSEQKRAQEWENRYKDESIKTTLQAAVSDPDVFNARQMVMTLKPYTKLVQVGDEMQVVVDLEDEIDGKPVITRLSPDAAVKRMKELPLIYGGFFKTNMVAGVGAGSGADAAKSAKVDISKMSQEEYRKWRKEHPHFQ